MGKREKRDKDEPHCLVLINISCGTQPPVTSFKHNPNSNSSTFQSLQDTSQYSYPMLFKQQDNEDE